MRFGKRRSASGVRVAGAGSGAGAASGAAGAGSTAVGASGAVTGTGRRGFSPPGWARWAGGGVTTGGASVVTDSFETFNDPLPSKRASIESKSIGNPVGSGAVNEPGAASTAVTDRAAGAGADSVTGAAEEACTGGRGCIEPLSCVEVQEKSRGIFRAERAGQKPGRAGTTKGKRQKKNKRSPTNRITVRARKENVSLEFGRLDSNQYAMLLCGGHPASCALTTVSVASANFATPEVGAQYFPSSSAGTLVLASHWTG